LKEIEIMTEVTTRRGAIATAIVGATAVMTGSVTSGNAPAIAGDDHSFGMARRGERGPMQSALRVIAADDFKPVSGVEVFLTHVGKGADGGGALETSDNDGIVLHQVWPGPWQVRLTPPKGSRFSTTAFEKIENMLTVQPDGSCFPTQFRLAVVATEWREMRDHVHEAK
jgi:hypothetical protein